MNAMPVDRRRHPTSKADGRFWLAVALSAMLHLLFVWIFLNREEKFSLMEAEKVEKGIEVTLTTLPNAKPAAKPPQPIPILPAAPKLPAPVKPAPKVKPVVKPKPAAPKPPERPRARPPEQTTEPKPAEPRPVKQPRHAKPAKEEPVPEFKDDFQQLSNAYTRDAAEAKTAEPSTGGHAKADTGVHPGAILNINPRIHYPLNAMRQGQRGVVVVLIHIGKDGHTNGVDLIRSSGYDELDNQVLGAVQHWRFTPPMRGNLPVESTYKHTVIFGADEEVIDDFATHWQQIKLLPADRRS